MTELTERIGIYCVILTLIAMLLSFPNSYTVDFWASQTRQCKFRQENPIVRTFYGAVSYLGGFPLAISAGTKIYETTIPKAKNYHRNGLPCQ